MCQAPTCSVSAIWQQPPEPAARDDLVHPAVEGGVAQHVADLEDAAGLLRRLDHPLAIRGLRRDRLLEQHVVAAREGREGRLDVQRVAGGDDRGLGELGPCEQLAPVAEERPGAERVLARHRLAARRIGLGDGDDAQPLRMGERLPAVDEPAAVARADHDGAAPGCVMPVSSRELVY